jgi:PAP2 superfamily
VLALRDNRVAASARRAVGPDAAQRRMLIAGPIVAIVSMVAAVLATNAAGIEIRDPDHVAGRRLLILFGLVGALVAIDIAVRASRRCPTWKPTRAAMARVRRERWTLHRGVAVLTALISFYVSYLAYRNLKSIVPLLRPGELYDRQLADLDRAMFGGSDPAAILHGLFGTGAAMQFFSLAYMLFFIFIPGTLAAALVFSPNLRAGLFYATAQSLNWLIGAASYFLLPSLGPIYYEPAAFQALPPSAVTSLQDLLLEQRIDFVSDPATGAAQSIAAFASLHVSIFFTGVLAAHMFGLARGWRIGAWALLGLTTLSTIYLGWHYVLDDVAGLVLGAMAIVLARALTGFDVRTAREELPATKPATA